MAKEMDVPKSFVQFFSDGRDTSPTSGGSLDRWYKNRKNGFFVLKTISWFWSFSLPPGVFKGYRKRLVAWNG